MNRKIVVDLIDNEEVMNEVGFLFRPEDPDDPIRPTPTEIVDALTDVLLEMYGGIPIILDRKPDA